MYFKIPRYEDKSKGFTLIEIIVVFSVIAIISTVGIAAFVSYSKTQALQASYLDFINTLNKAKAYSLSQVKPTRCDQNLLNGYDVVLNYSSDQTSQDSYSLYVRCGDQDQEPPLKTAKLPQTVRFNPIFTTYQNYFFPILSNTLTPASIRIQRYENGSFSDCLLSADNCRDVIIDSGGIR